MQDCASTAVSSYAWSATAQELAVLFKADDRTLYVYTGVTASEADALQTAHSKGSFIMRAIKAKHDVRKELIK